MANKTIEKDDRIIGYRVDLLMSKDTLLLCSKIELIVLKLSSYCPVFSATVIILITVSLKMVGCSFKYCENLSPFSIWIIKFSIISVQNGRGQLVCNIFKHCMRLIPDDDNKDN